MSLQAIAELKKIELHCHLDGSLSLPVVEKLAGRKVSMDELSAADDCKDLKTYLEKFDLPISLMQEKESLTLIAYDFMRQMALDHVAYVEVRFAPQFSTAKGLTITEVIEAVNEGLKKGEKEFGIAYGIIVCAMRHMSEEENYKMIKEARELLHYGVCGADLAGDEASYPMHQFINLFEQVKKLDMPFTIHAGECGSVANIREAVAVGAKRIGHGIALSDHPKDIKEMAEKRIGIEMCPISNLQTKAVKDMRVYPFEEFLRAGCMVTINTDNKTVSRTNMMREYERLSSYFELSRERAILLCKNAIEVSFASDDVKHHLLKNYE